MKQFQVEVVHDVGWRYVLRQGLPAILTEAALTDLQGLIIARFDLKR